MRPGWLITIWSSVPLAPAQVPQYSAYVSSQTTTRWAAWAIPAKNKTAGTMAHALILIYLLEPFSKVYVFNV